MLDLLIAGYSGPLDVEQHLEIATAYEVVGDSDAALAHRQAAAESADDPALWREVADAHRVAGNWQAALQAYEAVTRLAPDDVEAYYWAGVILLPYDVRHAYEQLIHAETDSLMATAAQTLTNVIVREQMAVPAELNLQLGMALAALGHWAQAEQCFANATAYDTEYGEAWAYQGLARSQQGFDAEALFQRAFLVAVDRPLVTVLHGLSLRASGDYVGALQELVRAQEMKPDNPAFAAELGATFRLLGDHESAEQWLRSAVQESPGDREFLNLLAMFYAEDGYNLRSNGLSVLQEAVALQPDDPDLRAAYAWALYQLGEVAAAQQNIELARSLDPANPRALYYQGLMYQAQSQDDLATEALLQLLDLPRVSGFDVLARRVLERLD